MARGAGSKVAVPLAHPWRNDCRYFHRTGLTQQIIAPQAAGKRRHRAEEVESPKHFGELSAREDLPHPVAVGHLAALEQIAISGEQNPPLCMRDLSEFFVAAIVAPGDIESSHSQVDGQPAQVYVENEARPPKGR